LFAKYFVLLLPVMSIKSEMRCMVLLGLLFLMLCGKYVESKKYMRCELTRVMVENYRFQKTLMSNC